MPASIIPKCADGSAMAALGEERLNVVDFRPATPAVWKPCRTMKTRRDENRAGSQGKPGNRPLPVAVAIAVVVVAVAVAAVAVGGIAVAIGLR